MPEPLYSYKGDLPPGDAMGNGIKANGAAYHLVNPEGKKVASSKKG